MKSKKILTNVDHIALQVSNIKRSVEFYTKAFKCEVIYIDDSWALIQFNNIKLAFVLEDQHPNHFAVVDPKVLTFKNLKFHRDGIGYVYIKDLDENIIEIIDKTSSDDIL